MLGLERARAGGAVGGGSVDTSGGTVLQTPQSPSRPATSSRAQRRVNHRAQFSLLIVRGDGARVLRFNFPRRLPMMALGGALAGAVALAALVGDWWHVRQKLDQSASLFRQLDEQRATIESFNRRVAELRKEVSGWRELHARIWEPFGPELQPRGRETGIGGRTEPEEQRPAGASTPLDELDRLSETVMQEGQSLRALDRLIARARKAIVSLPSRWPVRGGVNSEFGKRVSPWTQTSEFHGGIDIAAGPGTPVRAPAPGTVVHAGVGGEFGLSVILDHGSDIRTVYGHLSKVKVRPGDRVERGAEIALSGNTGRSTGPHLHYEIHVKGQPVNPRAYFWD